MDLRTIRYFIAAVEAGSLSRAAGSLFIAQPALTAQIKKLEGELGAKLFERSHAGVTPTPAGLQLYEDARRLLSDADTMRERIQRLPQGPEGSVTIAAPFLLASLLLGPALAQLKQTYPRIRVFVLDDLSLMVKNAMLDRRADVGILVNTLHVDGLRCRPLARESMYISGLDADGSVAALLQPPCKESLFERPDIDFAKAVQLPLLLQSRRFSIRQNVEDAAASLGLALNVAHEHDSVRVIRSLYMCGAGFTFTPACSLADSPPPASNWLIARVVRPELPRSYHLATQADRMPSTATQVVIEAIEQIARRLIQARIWEAELLLTGVDSTSE